MRLFTKSGRAAALLCLLLAGTGCGGFTASHSVSPASFFLPGLIQVAPGTGADSLVSGSSHTPQTAWLSRAN